MFVSKIQGVIKGGEAVFTDIRNSGCSIILILSVFATGCSTISTVTPDGHRESRSVDEFKSYAEDVFRRQNKASSELILLLIDIESSDQENYSKLQNAEKRIMDACQPLNSMAVMMVENRKIDMSMKYSVMTSVSECDYITRDVEELLRGY